MFMMLIAQICLAMNIYHEDRSHYDGMAMVAMVTMNRADHDPKKVCDVVNKPKQFSWLNDVTGEKDKVERILKALKKRPKEKKAWDKALAVAKDALHGRLDPRIVRKIGRADHFYNPDLANPYWGNKFKVVAKIGGHLVLDSKLKPEPLQLASL